MGGGLGGWGGGRTEATRACKVVLVLLLVGRFRQDTKGREETERNNTQGIRAMWTEDG